MPVLCHDGLAVHVVDRAIIINFGRHTPGILNIEKYNKSIEDSSLDEKESLWQEAKSATKSGRSPDKADKSGGKAD